MRKYTLPEMERLNAAATPWPEIERLARAIVQTDCRPAVDGKLDEAERISALAERIVQERPYIGIAGAHELIALASVMTDSETGTEIPIDGNLRMEA